MIQNPDHQNLVASQFGPKAQAYVHSPVHAEGADLDQIESATACMRPAWALDLGCGGGHVAYRLARHATCVVACDLSADMLKAVDEGAAQRGVHNIRTIRAAAEHLPFGDASFDLVASRFSAHHWTRFGQGVAEAARVLTPGGKAIFADGVSLADGALDTHLQAIELLRDPSHVRDRSLAEWGNVIAGAGLTVTSIRTARLRMEFASWAARMSTPPPIQAAIRYLQERLDAEARAYFEVEADGSFQLDTVVIEATKPAVR